MTKLARARMPQSKGIQSLDTGMAVALAVARAGKPVALTDIAKQLDMLPSTAHRHLASLARSGLVEQQGPAGRYDLGPAAVEIGFAALRRLDRQRLWNEAIERLRDATDLTAMAIAWGTFGPTVVQWKESRQPVWMNAHAGTVLPLTRSASGLIYCAFSPLQQVAQAIEREFQQQPEPTRNRRRLTRGAFDKLLHAVRRAGYADIDGDVMEGVAAASAPVFDSNGNVAVALAILGPTSQVDLDARGPHIQTLLRVARQLSSQLGYQADTVAVAHEE